MTTTTNTSASGSFSENNVIVVLGAQWGDEGKGKLVDIIGQEAEVCARFAVCIDCGKDRGEELIFHSDFGI